MAFMKVMDRSEAEAFLKTVREYHVGKRSLPPEILEKKQQIDEAIKNAEMFMICFRVVDMSLINDVVQLKLEIDSMYADWGMREGQTIH